MLPSNGQYWLLPTTDAEPTLPFADPRTCSLCASATTASGPTSPRAKPPANPVSCCNCQASRSMSTIQRTCANFSLIPAKPARKNCFDGGGSRTVFRPPVQRVCEPGSSSSSQTGCCARQETRLETTPCRAPSDPDCSS